MTEELKRRPNGNVGEETGTSGYAKDRKIQAYGGSVVEGVDLRRDPERDQQQTGRHTAGDIILQDLQNVNLAQYRIVNNNLIDKIGNPDVLKIAYLNIKSKPGNMTSGIDDETLDGINNDWFLETSRKILDGTYRFKPGRRVLIPKPGKPGETRPLGIASPREKIVQKAMGLVLESIFEPKFLETSHGFRPGKGNHTALKYIRFQLKSKVWVIEADLTKCFDRIQHDVLIRCIRKRVSCEPTIKLLESALKAGFIDLKFPNKVMDGEMGTPQGSIISPLLSNIILHELDCFIAELRAGFEKGTTRRVNPVWKKKNREMNSAKSTAEIKTLRNQLWKIPSKDPMDPNFRRLCYVRYADDFIIGLTCSYKEVLEVKEKVKIFLNDQLKLELNDKKTKITPFTKRKPVIFLGTEISGRVDAEKPIRSFKSKGTQTRKSRITPEAQFRAPIAKLFEKATSNGFLRKDKGLGPRPTALRRIMNMDHADIITYYNQVIRGILNYYSFVDNRSSLGSLVWAMKQSCALTLALKYKLKTASQAYRKFGTRLGCKATGRELFLPETLAKTSQFMVSVEDSSTILSRRWNNKLTHSNLDAPCLICQSPNSEMHHVKYIRDLKSKYEGAEIDFWTLQMRAINRKQIPLCRDHHSRKHSNTLTENERELLIFGIAKYVDSKKPKEKI